MAFSLKMCYPLVLCSSGNGNSILPFLREENNHSSKKPLRLSLNALSTFVSEWCPWCLSNISRAWWPLIASLSSPWFMLLMLCHLDDSWIAIASTRSKCFCFPTLLKWLSRILPWLSGLFWVLTLVYLVWILNIFLGCYPNNLLLAYCISYFYTVVIKRHYQGNL